MNQRTIPFFTQVVRLVLAATLVACVAPSASAQLDPLLSLKRLPPNVIVVFDTSFRMLEDGAHNLYDPGTYNRADDVTIATALGVPSTVTTYHRVYHDLFPDDTQDATHRYKVRAIQPSWGTVDASNIDHFWDSTRYEIARKGLREAVRRNVTSPFRWGLMTLRHNGIRWRYAGTANDCERPVRWATEQMAQTTNAPVAQPTTTSGAIAYDQGCGATLPGTYGIKTPYVAASNAGVSTAVSLIVSPSSANSGTTLKDYLAPTIPNNSLIPGGLDMPAGEDRPLFNALVDAKTQVTALMTGDAEVAARNTVVILIAGGKDSGASDPALKAAEFKTITAGGVTRRVPIFVIAVNPDPSDYLQLYRIGVMSGGRSIWASSWVDVMRGVNIALQSGFTREADFQNSGTSEFLGVSPVVGTVNLENAQNASGTSLDATLVSTPAGTAIPQRNNLMLTSGFVLGPSLTSPMSPGFEGRLRAFRPYKPVPDSTKPSGYTFTKDGTALWPDRDGRPALAGMARTPLDSSLRNIYTYIPGHGMVAFNSTNAATLQPYLFVSNPNSITVGSAANLIDFVRNLPLGAIIGSTPAITDPPSLDPPPDDDYGRADAPGTYAGDHKDRRSIIWVGANDGMLHAIDARTGFEVWAFIPFNLLPKLQTLYGGQPVDQFNYFVDQSPKIAEVKLNGAWRSLLLIGEGWGGTFYQAFDITEAGMGGPAPTSDDYSSVISSFSSGSRVQFLWSFPDYAHFDTTLYQHLAVTDASPGGFVNFFGELNGLATNPERKVGFTWSDPAVGPLNLDRSVNVAIVGSGYYPNEAEDASNSSSFPTRRSVGVGHAFYLLDLTTGQPLGTDGACTGQGCLDVGDATSPSRKNALQADPTVTGAYGSYVATKAYLGDVDGNYWRFNFTSAGVLTKTLLYTTSEPVYSSSALMWVGSTGLYLFYATGSDWLPTAPSSAGGTGTFSMVGLQDLGTSATRMFEVDLGATTNSTGNFAVGERPSTSPSVAGDIVFFTTSTEGSAASTEPTFRMYAFTYTGTDAYATSSTTATKSNGKSKSGTTVTHSPVKTGTGRATAPFIVDQHLYFATSGSGGATVEAFGDPNDFNNGVGQVGVRILSWREIRR